MLDSIDRSVFLFLNSFHSPFWDKVMWMISAKLTWLPLYLAIIIFLILREKRKAILLIPLLILSVVITDQVSVHCFKEVFERLRPCHQPSLEGMVHIVNGKCGGKFGFVSSHAANTFGIAILSLLIFKKRWYSLVILAWASLVSYSRIYLGVHYPGDILGGALLGIVTGYVLYYLYLLAERKYLVGIDFFSKRR